MCTQCFISAFPRLINCVSAHAFPITLVGQALYWHGLRGIWRAMLAQGLYLSCSWSISLASFLIKLLFSFYTSSCPSFLYSQTLLTSFFIAFSVQSVFVSSMIIVQMCLRMPIIRGTVIGRKLGTWYTAPEHPNTLKGWHVQWLCQPCENFQDISNGSLQHWAVHYHTATGVDGCGWKA